MEIDNNICMTDYRTIPVTIGFMSMLCTVFYICNMFVAVVTFEPLDIVSASYVLALKCIAISLSCFLLTYCIGSPQQRLALHDVSNNYKDESMYLLCEVYRKEWDKAHEDKIKRETNNEKTNACRKCINDRFKNKK